MASLEWLIGYARVGDNDLKSENILMSLVPCLLCPICPLSDLLLAENV